MDLFAILAPLALIVTAFVAWGSAQRSDKSSREEWDSYARYWFFDNPCPKCGAEGQVDVQSDSLSGYPYRANCNACGASFVPDHKDESGPWMIDELDELIEKAKARGPMTEEEIQELIRQQA